MRVSLSGIDLDALIMSHNVTGISLAMFHDGQISTLEAGTANVETGEKITKDTLMHIGSICKVFTSTLVMQLVDEKIIELDDLLVEHLPEPIFKDEVTTRKTTIRMLLNHSSGIDADMPPDHGHDKETIDEAILRFRDIGQIHEPGAMFSYCNGGFVLAGHLLQRLTGKSWYTLIKERIYIPLNMTKAVTLPEEALLYQTSTGHLLHPGNTHLTRVSFSLLPLSFSPAGTSLMMTAKDLISFACTHLRDGIGINGSRIISDKNARNMRKRTISCDELFMAHSIGLGWMLFPNGLVGHGGYVHGSRSMLYLCPEQDFAVAILANSDNSSVLIGKILDSLLKQVVGPKTSPALHKSKRLKSCSKIGDSFRYVGVYENSLMRYSVSIFKGGLVLSMHFRHAVFDNSITEPTDMISLVSVGEDEFLLYPDEGDRLASLMPPGPMHISFRYPDTLGRPQYIAAAHGRLLRRVS